jgi:hypothetical protein
VKSVLAKEEAESKAEPTILTADAQVFLCGRQSANRTNPSLEYIAFRPVPITSE